MNYGAWSIQGWQWLPEVVLRSSLIVLLATMVALILRKRAASLRRQIWAATIVCLVALPVLSAVFPAVEAPLLPPERVAQMPPLQKFQMPVPPWVGPPPAHVNKSDIRLPSTSNLKLSKSPRIEATAPVFGIRSFLLGLYATGLLVSLRRLIGARRKASKLARAARKAPTLWHRDNKLDVRETDLLSHPITVGAFAPVILVPTQGQTWPPEWRDATLAHEAAHVFAKDPLLQLLAELCVAIYWFHPLVHFAAKQLRSERELAADDAVLATGVDGVDYAALLYELACLPDNPPVTGALVPLLTPAGLKARVVRLLEQNRSRARSTLARVAVSLLSAITLVPLALAIPMRQPPQKGLGLGIGRTIGKVVDEKTQTPVPGAIVSFRFDGWPPTTAEVLTDDQGMFQYPWDQPLEEHFGVYARKGEQAARKPVLAVPFGTRLPLDLTLRRAPTLSGRVIEEDDAPVANATVSVWLEDNSFGPGQHAIAKTDQQGFWQLPGVLYGKYLLLVVAPWGVKATALVGVDGEDVGNIEVRVPRQRPRTGWLHDEDGKPLANFRFTTGVFHVSVAGMPTAAAMGASLGERHIEWDETAEDGSFSLLPIGRSLPIAGALSDGTKYFGTLDRYARSPQDEPRSGVVMSGYPKPRITTLSRSRRISGIVSRRNGGPVAEAVVSVGSSHSHATEFATTDEHGAFVLNEVPPGEVVLMAGELIQSFPYVKSHGQVQLDIPPMDLKDVKIFVDERPAAFYRRRN